jgi:hypothetical protein
LAKTLLDGVNEILKRVGVVAGDAGVLLTLTNSARQRAIDMAVQVINEGIDGLYTASGKPHTAEQTESTITLVDGTRAYALAADLVQIRWPFIDRTNRQYITEYPGGYNQLLVDDPGLDATGLPHFADIRPTDGMLYLDRAPTSEEAGRVYYYQYDKDLSLEAADDEVPFADVVFRAMVPVWVQLWKREMRNQFDAGLFSMSLGRASRTLTQKQVRTHYGPRG